LSVREVFTEAESRMESDFLGKKLIVIGRTSGIGKEVASVVLRNGGSVMVVVRRDDKTKAATVELGLRGEVSGWTGDITNGASRADLIQDLNGKHADATMLVNAAGVFVPKSFLEHSETDYDKYLEL